MRNKKNRNVAVGRQHGMMVPLRTLCFFSSIRLIIRNVSYPVEFVNFLTTLFENKRQQMRLRQCSSLSCSIRLFTRSHHLCHCCCSSNEQWERRGDQKRRKQRRSDRLDLCSMPQWPTNSVGTLKKKAVLS